MDPLLYGIQEVNGLKRGAVDAIDCCYDYLYDYINKDIQGKVVGLRCLNEQSFLK